MQERLFAWAELPFKSNRVVGFVGLRGYGTMGHQLDTESLFVLIGQLEGVMLDTILLGVGPSLAISFLEDVEPLLKGALHGKWKLA